MADQDSHAGVMDQQYAEGRKKQAELVYRYKVRARVVVEAIEKYLGLDGKITLLDFGPAEGLTLLEMNALVPEGDFTGVEYSQELLDRAPALPPNVRLVQGDVMDLDASVKEKTYDAVSALALLEHLSEPIKAVRQAVEVLRPGGLFIATCPNPLWDAISGRLGMHKDEYHEAEMNKERLIAVSLEAGLEVIAFRRFMWAPYAVLPYMKVPLSASLSLRLDRMVGALRVFNGLFVNQCVIARKP